MTDKAPTRAARLEATLREALAPALLVVEDESARHAGHAGARPGGESHYKITAVSARFNGLGRLDRSRMVHAMLAGEFAGGLHALSLTLRSTNEA